MSIKLQMKFTININHYFINSIFKCSHNKKSKTEFVLNYQNTHTQHKSPASTVAAWVWMHRGSSAYSSPYLWGRQWLAGGEEVIFVVSNASDAPLILPVHSRLIVSTSVKGGDVKSRGPFMPKSHVPSAKWHCSDVSYSENTHPVLGGR